MFKLLFIIIIFFPLQSFSAENEHKVYKIVELDKDELKNVITSIPLIGDILKKDSIKDELLYIKVKKKKVIVHLKKTEKSFENKNIFTFTHGINIYQFNLKTNSVVQLNENKKIIKKFNLKKIIDTNIYSKKINLLFTEKSNLINQLDKSNLSLKDKNDFITKLEAEFKNILKFNTKLEEEIKTKINQKNQLIAKLEIEIKEIVQLNSKLEDNNKKKISEKNQLITKLETEIKDIIKLNSKLETEMKDIIKLHSKLEDNNKKKISAKNQLIAKLETELKNVIQLTEKLKEVENKTKINSINTTVEKLKNELKSQISINKKEHDSYNFKIISKEKIIQQLEAELKKQKSIINKLKEENIPFYKKLIK